ncbi:unnamed protein product, partial [Hapterophycus canaliculatus]
FWHINAGHAPTFLPSVAEPWHLSTMLRHIFRLAICSSKDDRGWSALHQACIENHVCSHEDTIRVLVHYHQLDLFQTDMNGKLAVEHLFCFEGGRPNTPSGSREKEGLLIDQRKEILTEARKRHDVEDEEEKERGRVKTLLNVRQASVDMKPELWLATQEARHSSNRNEFHPLSVHLRTLGGWMEYVDPETLNRFFYKNELVLRVSDEDVKSKESVDHFQWEMPEDFARAEAVLLGWASVINGSEFLRTHAGSRYNSVLDRRSGVVFYVDTSNEACLLVPPRETTLAWAFEHSQGTGRVLGQRREERPVDAVPSVDLTAGDYSLCTMDGDMEMFRVCVACARNCHKGRLGHRTRFCKLSNTRCMCCERGDGCCLYFSKKICRRKSDTPEMEGWVAFHDPELPGSGYVVRAISDDWYLVRIHGRSAASDESASPEELELPKPEPLEWEFQKNELSMVGTRHFFFHEERRECTWDPPPEITLGNLTCLSLTTNNEGDDTSAALRNPSSLAGAAAAAAAETGATTLVEGANGDEGTAGVAPRQGVFLGEEKTLIATGETVARSETEEIAPSAGTGQGGSPSAGDGGPLIGAPGDGSGLFSDGESTAGVKVRT